MTDPADYAALLAEMESSGGAISSRTRFSLARKAFSHTAAYDSAISNYLTAIDVDGSGQQFPERLNLNFAKVQDLRYGENPHQQAAFYRDLRARPGRAVRITFSCRARSCRTTISPMPMRPGNASRPSTSRPA